MQTKGCGPELFAEAMNTLEILRLQDASFTKKQAKLFFKRMHEETCLKELYMQKSKYNPSLVDSKDFVGGLSKIQKLGLSWCHRHEDTWPDHIEELLKIVSKQGEGSVVTEIDFNRMSFSYFPADLLAATVNKVERTILWGCHLEARQMFEIFAAAASGSSSKYLDFRVNEGETIENREFWEDYAKTLAKGAKNFEHLKVTNLCRCRIESILDEVSLDTKLKILEVDGQNEFTSDDIRTKQEVVQVKITNDANEPIRNMMTFWA